MHFKDYHQMLDHVCEKSIWNVHTPTRDTLEQGFFFSLLSTNVQRHSCDVPLRNGSAIKYNRVFVDTNRGWMQLCSAAYRALDATYRMSNGTDSDPIRDYDYHLQRKGYGRDTRYVVLRRPVLDPDPFGYQRSASAVSSSVDPNYIGPPKPTVPTIQKQKVTPTRSLPYVEDWDPFGPSHVPAVRAVCRCDIKDLLSNGHTKGCPEKKR